MVCLSLFGNCSEGEFEVLLEAGGKMHHVGSREERKLFLQQLDLKIRWLLRELETVATALAKWMHDQSPSERQLKVVDHSRHMEDEEQEFK